ncbi:MAG: DUF896 domain-containing protein [Eubacteriales bacterium]|nr:DUF896 domain-containing protein [Eubacteriales bacterium]
MDKRSIDRINQLARAAKERPLTPEEDEERAELRLKYLAAFRQSFRNQLDSTKVEYPDGSRRSLKDANGK